MKRLLTLVLIFATLFSLGACGAGDKDGLSTTEDGLGEPNLFDGLKDAEKLDTQWLFIPDNATVLRKSLENDDYCVRFKGAEAEDINAYAEKMFDTLKERGATIYDCANVLEPVKLEAFVKADLDTSFAGTAYSYYYALDGQVYMIVLKYYGCAGGSYGNGQSELIFSDVTDRIASLLEE